MPNEGQEQHSNTAEVAVAHQAMPVVAIGASAGGLVACQRLLDVLPAGHGMAFILVQHLEPTHQSLMVDLLATHTTMTVLQAVHEMILKPDHLYTIPPGTYLSTHNQALVLSQPTAPHGARLPFDFLLNSMAEAFGEHAMCVVLSGTGSDGSHGLQAIHREHGFVIAQRPEEADYDGMPRNAIATDAVDQVLPIAEIPQALLDRAAWLRAPERHDHAVAEAAPELAEIIALLRSQTAQDFGLYKSGTLQRRIARRMAMVRPVAADIAAYLALLRQSPAELDILAKDLLIHVTAFFRDPKVFELLAKTTLPELIERHAPGGKLRLWTPGCSTGEETYSLVILLLEQIAASGRDVKLQVFASDVDPDAVATAREGLYPESIETQISAERLARFFVRDGGSYRVRPELRSAVVFAVQDVLADPPFSRLNMISCRNLLIYLRPEAQAKVIAMFHFALEPDGILLLGNAETAGSHHGFFEIINKSAKLYRHVARSRSGEMSFGIPTDGTRVLQSAGAMAKNAAKSAPRASTLAELCRRMVLEAYAPAAVLINRQYETLYSFGPVDHYLRLAPGMPTHDVLAMARPGMRTKLRLAIDEALHGKTRVVSKGYVTTQGDRTSFSIEVHPVPGEAVDLLLLCFVDERPLESASAHAAAVHERPRVAELERQLEAARRDLSAAIRNLEIANEEQSEISEEALSVNEEHQATNEELLASKEELQSLNEELTALNGQLQETLDRQRTTADDLQNVLYSTDVATLFLDTDLRIRFFTPSMRAMFNLIPGDIGRPIADLNPLVAETNVTADSNAVIAGLPFHETEQHMPNGTWISHRILPYRTRDGDVAGVVITYTDITGRKQISEALERAMHNAEIANRAKSRFLAAASHDLRQPLQTLSLLQGALARTVISPQSKALVVRLDEALSGVSSMLNTLLDINEIETGSVIAEMVEFPVNDLLLRLRDQFSFHAEAQKLEFRVVPNSTIIRSDPRLLEQILRNYLSNALKYTSTGRVLLGCRRAGDRLNIEVWDTGAGIAKPEHQAIFQEYHQLNNAGRERSRGLGLGLSIVQQLADFLGHKIAVHSVPGKGSMFSVSIAMGDAKAAPASIRAEVPPAGAPSPPNPPGGSGKRAGRILVVEDDLSVRDLLAQLLLADGHTIIAESHGPAAMEMLRKQRFLPDLILTDYNLPHGMDGVAVVTALRSELRAAVPAIVLTGDISRETLRNITRHNCVHLNKPIKLEELASVIERLLALPVPVISPSPLPVRAPARPEPNAAKAIAPGLATVIVIDDDPALRAAMRTMFEIEGYAVRDFASAEDFLLDTDIPALGCLLIDAYLPGMSGLALLKQLTARLYALPMIMITGRSDVALAVEAMKSGATDFIDKPATAGELLEAVGLALERLQSSTAKTGKLDAWHATARKTMSGLTQRQHEIMAMVLAGHPSKNIAADLNISQRTVENHRAAIMRKTGSKSLPALARLALAAGEDPSSAIDTSVGLQTLW
jgi:two-component system CheB/CheR fusion protein